MGVKAVYSVGDMRKRADVETMMDKALGTFGGVNVLVNTVGGGLIGPRFGRCQKSGG